MDQILKLIPHKDPFRFVDTITYVDESKIEGQYYFDHNSAFYKGHYPGYPVTPGVILTEVMAQIGLVVFGLYLLFKADKISNILDSHIPVLASTHIDFHKPVLPGETVFVESEKILFRHKKLVCKTKLLNKDRGLVAEGTITGYIFSKNQVHH